MQRRCVRLDVGGCVHLIAWLSWAGSFVSPIISLLVSSLLLGFGSAGMGGFWRLCVCRLNYSSLSTVTCLLIVTCLVVFLLHMTIMFYVWNILLGVFCDVITFNVRIAFSSSAPILWSAIR